MTTSWDDHATDWEQQEAVRFYADQAFASLLRHVVASDDVCRRKNVLDFGCGTGLLTEKLAPMVAHVVAVDTSSSMIDVLRDKAIGNVSAVCVDVDDPAVRSSVPWFEDLDLIVASSVCGFLPDYERTLAILAGALGDSGLFVQWDWLAAADDDDGMTVERVSKAFDDVGLTCVYLDEAFAITLDGRSMPVLMGVASAT